MLKLSRFLKPYRGLLLLILVLALGQAVSNLYLPNLMANIVDNGIVKNDPGYIWTTGSLMLLVSLGGIVCALVGIFYASRVATSFGKTVRARIFTHVTGFSLHEFDRVGAASLITHTTNDTTQIQSVLVMLLNVMITAPITLVGGIVLAINQDVGLSWIFVVVLPVLLAVIILLMRRSIPLFTVIQSRLDKINLILNENLTGVRVIRAFNRSRQEEQRFEQANIDLTAVAVTVNRLVASLMPILLFVLDVCGLAILWFGAGRIDRGEMQAGSLFAFLQYAMQILFALLMVSMMFALLPRATASAVRINHVLAMEPELTEAAAPQELPAGVGSLEFEQVSFNYPGAQEPAIVDITFRARRGEITAIVGGTGAGKSTLVGLIPRFYDVSRGRILLDGVDIRALARQQLRARIGLVAQKTLLFSGTVAENVRLGKNAASVAEIERAIRIAQASDFIAALPAGIETVLARGATNLSGGQRQRLSIARALVRQPAIYLFDDSFSALDVQTDAKLRVALRREVQDAIVLIVTQRVSTIMDADQIIVLDQGQMVGIGTHRTLMERCEIYREIVASQLSAEEIAGV
ncbi:MAG TPA: ABC transporter ATP-binding protein [Ktedonobacteraceae bacterium]|jgi:ATP-binding cassette subfamily B protein